MDIRSEKRCQFSALCSFFSSSKHHAVCLLPQVCELLIVNTIFLFIFSPFGALPFFFPVFLKKCAAMRYCILQKRAVVVAD